MRALTVLYDEGCAFCRRMRVYLEAQRALVQLELLPRSSPEAIARFGKLGVHDDDLWVVSDEGDAWVGPPAFVMCLWALDGTHELGNILATPLLAPLAERFFRALSSERRRLSAFFDDDRCGEHGCRLPSHGPYR
jgi:predicted DCC family thiol-disulfide oxidoreductase YuxK